MDATTKEIKKEFDKDRNHIKFIENMKKICQEGLRFKEENVILNVIKKIKIY